MPDVRLDTTRWVESVCEVAPGAVVQRLLVPGMAVGVIIDRRCVADGVEVMRSVISETPECVQRRCGGGVLTRDCRGCRTPSLGGITLASQCGKASLSRGKLRIPRRPTLLLFLNNSYDRSRARVRALGRYSPI